MRGEEAGTGSVYDEATFRFDMLRHSMQHAPNGTIRARRDLLHSLYQTTGAWARMMDKTGIYAIHQGEVDELATAMLATVRATVAGGTAREQVTLQADLDSLPFKGGLFTETLGPSNVWGLLRTPRVVKHSHLQAWVFRLEDVRKGAVTTRRATANIQANLKGLDDPINGLQGTIQALKTITKRGLLEDWELREEEIVWKASVWRQNLAQVCACKTFSIAFGRADDPLGFWGDVLGFLEVIFEPLTNTALVTVAILPFGEVFMIIPALCIYVAIYVFVYDTPDLLWWGPGASSAVRLVFSGI
ncbi:hypothetical protein PG994_004980 [Apiospora phragmitis]|uniref:Uncharacterized protein n=1 Tax=Apiospora phragmitis TaxID=2905665 RepID=A0ABR1VS59_9PEZI